MAKHVKPLVVHLLTADAPPSTRLSLDRLLSQPDLAAMQHVCQLGPGPWVRFGGPVARIHAPAPIPWLGGYALRRHLRRLGLWENPRSLVLHAWSPGAAAWARPLSAGHRPLLVEVEADDDLGPLVRWSGCGALGIVCRSATTRLRLIELGMPAARVRLIRPGVDASPIDSGRREFARRRLRLESCETAIAALPPVTRRGGTFVATWAALLTEKVRPGVRLILPTEGPDAERVWRLAADCRHERMMRFAPSDLSLGDVLAASDLAAFTPLDDASIAGLAEAVAANVPIVATDVPTVREWLTHERTAWLCRPSDPKDAARWILHAVDHVEESRLQAERARALVSDLFSVRAMLAAYQDVYTRLGDRRPVVDESLKSA